MFSQNCEYKRIAREQVSEDIGELELELVEELEGERDRDPEVAREEELEGEPVEELEEERDLVPEVDREEELEEEWAEGRADELEGERD